MPDELTPEEVMAQLKTRGFEEGFQDTPVKEFKARLDSITGEMRDNKSKPGTKRLYVNYNFSELEVVESTEPYTLPILQLSMPHSNRTKSGMGFLGASIDRIINAGLPADAPATEVKGQDYLVGKVQRWKKTPGHMMWDGRAAAGAGAEVPKDAWELMELEGEDATGESVAQTPKQPGKQPVKAAPNKAVGKVSPSEQALKLLDGKSKADWHKIVFVDPLVKSDGKLIQSITKGTFIKDMEAAGTIVLDEEAGVYRVVA
jgi:hypothetical protein